ncbi:MAG: TetR/AcrR family transcriptional regulator [Spirochaetaceae bacterium]|nr:TetR/AcrR family transcriptional regulator [Spirochaetaceae bacterium]
MDTREAVFRPMIRDAASTKEKLFLSAVLLFSTRGYDRIGIRELAASVGIREASFYNHFAGKEALLNAIFAYWEEVNARTVLSPAEICAAVETGDQALALAMLMEKFRAATASPVVHAVLAIVRMEGFTSPQARPIALKNMYHVRRPSTLAILEGLRAKGRIGDIDLEAWISSYFYGLIGILDEYVLLELEGASLDSVMARVRDHIKLFALMLESGINTSRKESS